MNNLGNTVRTIRIAAATLISLFVAPAYSQQAVEQPSVQIQSNGSADYWQARAVHYFRELSKAHARLVEFESAAAARKCEHAQ